MNVQSTPGQGSRFEAWLPATALKAVVTQVTGILSKSRYSLT
jgi:hypothetical protein